ncbi:MAG TPA: DUF2946 family protein [Novosphingobium sp.]|nr:DUF2946 family protein [Novosphingobium sp.]
MHAWRAFLAGHRRWAFLLLALALAARAMVPAGFMPAAGAHGVAIEICSGSGGPSLFLALPGKTQGPEEGSDSHGGAPCAFSALADTGLQDGPVLALAAPALPPASSHPPLPAAGPSPAAAPYLLPPLRGPPALA